MNIDQAIEILKKRKNQYGGNTDVASNLGWEITDFAFDAKCNCICAEVDESIDKSINEKGNNVTDELIIRQADNGVSVEDNYKSSVDSGNDGYTFKVFEGEELPKNDGFKKFLAECVYEAMNELTSNNVKVTISVVPHGV